MTPSNSPWRRRGIATAAAVLLTTTSIATGVAGTAAAEPQKGQRQSFNDCFFDAWNKKPTMSYAEKQQVAENCCLNVGGIFNESTHTCYLGADNVTVEEPNPPVPPPSATAVLPPGIDTREAVQ